MLSYPFLFPLFPAYHHNGAECTLKVTKRPLCVDLSRFPKPRETTK